MNKIGPGELICQVVIEVISPWEVSVRKNNGGTRFVSWAPQAMGGGGALTQGLPDQSMIRIN